MSQTQTNSNFRDIYPFYRLAFTTPEHDEDYETYQAGYHQLKNYYLHDPEVLEAFLEYVEDRWDEPEEYNTESESEDEEEWRIGDAESESEDEDDWIMEDDEAPPPAPPTYEEASTTPPPYDFLTPPPY